MQLSLKINYYNDEPVPLKFSFANVIDAVYKWTKEDMLCETCT